MASDVETGPPLRSAHHAQHRLWTASLIGLGCISVAVMLPLAIGPALTGDEVSSAIVISKPGPIAALLQVVRGESTPPLWYGLGWLGHSAGLPIEWLRLLSVAAMAAAVMLTAVLARDAGLPVPACLLAGLLAAFGDQFTDHGAQLRAYALFCLLTVVFALVLLRADAQRLPPWMVAAVVAAGSLTHYYFLFSVAAGTGWLSLAPRGRATRRRLLTAIGVGLIPAALWLPAFVHQYQAQRFTWIGHFSARVVAASVANMFVSPWVTHTLPRSAELIGLLLAACGSVVLWGNPQGRLVVALAVVPLAGAALAWRLGFPVFDLRNTLGAAPFVAVTVAAVVARLRRFSVVAGVLLVALVLASFADARSDLGRTDFKRVAAALTARGWQPRDPIAVFGSVYGSVALAWSLPGHPRLDPGRPRASAGCRRLYVVAEDARGRGWLQRTGRPQTGVRAYGVADWAPPGPSFRVASVPLNPPTLARLRRSGAQVYAVRGNSACVEPVTPPA